MSDGIWIKKVNDGRYVVEDPELTLSGGSTTACNDFTEMLIRLSVIFGEKIQVERETTISEYLERVGIKEVPDED